ncbi:MAG: hypothetical protein JW913_19445 [Chitinispirillaceae bacterium]|nr:hypothetical protein [Chitinispirillaceae bacterium]
MAEKMKEFDLEALCDGEGIPYQSDTKEVVFPAFWKGSFEKTVVLNKDTYCWQDRATNESGYIVDLIERTRSCSQHEAIHLINWLYSRPIQDVSEKYWEPIVPVPPNIRSRVIGPEIHKMGRGPDAEFTYFTIDGNTFARVGKWYRSNNEIISLPFTYCKHIITGRESWQCIEFPASVPLFGVQYLKDWRGPVAVVESEELCVAVNKGVGDCCLPLTWYGGIADIEKTDWSPLAGSEVEYKVITDSEEKGNEILRRIQEAIGNVKY